MADISRLVLESIHSVTTLVENDEMQLNPNQCRHLEVCLQYVKDYFFSKPVHVYKQLLDRIRCTVKKVENFVIKCSSKDWLVNALSIGVSEEETKDLVLELRWCLDTHSQGPLAGQGQQYMMLPSEQDICQDKKWLVDKLEGFLSSTSERNEKHYLALYLQGRLKVLEEATRSTILEPSRLEHILWRKKLPELSKHEDLGSGRFATVFKASWLGVPCAKKYLKCAGDKVFGREAGALAMLNHPNIVTLYCCYEDKISQSLVMELMDGSLYNLLVESRSGSPFDLEAVVEILLQIVKGVLYLHENGFAHRDLKSPNILLTRSKGPQTGSSTSDFVVKVADFGLIKLFDPEESKLSVTTAKVGSGAWRAPEVLLNDDTKISPRRSDIYSFAMVCYEILSGEIPFKRFGLSNKELFYEIVHNGLRPPLPEDCPVALKTLIKDCWDADCAKRPTFDQIHDQLMRLRSSLMVGSPVIETLSVQELEQCATMRRPIAFITHMCQKVFSFSTNAKNLEGTSAVHQPVKEQGTGTKRAGFSEDLIEGIKKTPKRHRRISTHQLSFPGLVCLAPGLDKTTIEKYAEELDELDQAIAQAPTDPNALTSRSEIKAKLQDFEGSLMDLNEVAAIQPNDAPTLQRRGQIKHFLGDNKGALQDLDGAVEHLMPSRDGHLLNLRAQVKKLLGDYEGALQDLNAADSLVPHDALILGLRGEMKKNLKDFRGALQDLNEAHDLAPYEVYILNERAQVKSMNVDFKGAKEDLKRASRLAEARRSDHICREFPCPFCSGGRS